MNAVAEQQVAITPPQIGQAWPEQGGIYIGSRLKEGVLHHVVIAGGMDSDIKDVEFNGIDEALKGQEINGQSDWTAGDQRDVMLAYINVPELFDKDEIYWTSTPCGSRTAWAVDFEDGFVFFDYRSLEFRVRPFRSIVASSI